VLRFDVISIFPAMFDAVATLGVTTVRSIEACGISRWNPRFTSVPIDPSTIDPMGWARMVMLAQPLADTIAAARAQQEGAPRGGDSVLHLSPRGLPFDHERLLALRDGGGATLIANR
jgi:tRNA (guanine37-N1)-methyltransferase